MSAETPTATEETVAPAADAFGGGAQPPAREAATAAPEGETVEEQPTGEETPQEAPWAERFETAEQMWEHLQNVDSLRGRQANEIGELRRKVDALAAGQQPQPQQAAQEEQLTEEQLRDWYDEDPLAAGLYVQRLQLEAFAEEFSGRFQPVVQTVNQTTAAQTIERLKTEFGDDVVHRHREALHARIAGDEAWFSDPKTRETRLREAVAALEFERMRSGGTTPAPAAPRPPGGATRTAHVEGSSNEQPPAPAQDVDPEIAAIDAAGGGIRDIFGAH